MLCSVDVEHGHCREDRYNDEKRSEYHKQGY